MPGDSRPPIDDAFVTAVEHELGCGIGTLCDAPPRAVCKAVLKGEGTHRVASLSLSADVGDAVMVAAARRVEKEAIGDYGQDSRPFDPGHSIVHRTILMAMRAGIELARGAK